MCLGIPMQVQALTPGHALAVGRGQTLNVETALVGTPQPGDWLLVFMGSAREIISARRAAEVNATLDLVAAVVSGHDGSAAASFELPSAMSTEQLAALAGLPGRPHPTDTPAREVSP